MAVSQPPDLRSLVGPGPLTPLQLRAAFRAQLVLKNTTVRLTAKRMGVSHQHLTLVLGGQRVASKRLEDCIADFLGLDAAVIFAPKVLKRRQARLILQ
jgi:lambda repressor-like predicted transcriptional regulator